jgi:tricorn protease
MQTRSRSFPLRLLAWLVAFTLIWETGPEAAADELPVQVANDPALSPDGSQLVFSHRGALWAVATSGGRARRLTFHPDEDTSPSFSPDGKRLAFLSNRTGTRQVFVMNLVETADEMAAPRGVRQELPLHLSKHPGAVAPSHPPVAGSSTLLPGPVRQVTWHSEGFLSVQWFPDGEHLLVSGNRDHHWRHAERFFRVSIEDRTAEELLFDAYGSEGSLHVTDAESPGRLLFVREGERWWRKGYRGARSAQIWMYDFETERFSKQLDRAYDCRWPLWQPDGKGFYYVQGDRHSYDLWHCDLSDPELSRRERTRRITRFREDSVVFPALSADGSTLVFRKRFDLFRLDLTDENPRPRKIDITILDDSLDPDEQRRILERAEEAAFTADGLEIAFVSGGNLWVMETELKEPVRVTETAQEERAPLFSPDGNELYYVSDREGQTDLWKVARKDPELFWWQNTEFVHTRLTDDPEPESHLKFCPTGEYLYFVKGLGDLWRMKPDGSDAARVLTGFLPPSYDISPDGRWVVYSQVDDDFNSDVWILPSDGNIPGEEGDVPAVFPFNVSRHPRDHYDPVWSPDGKLIAFLGRRFADEVDIFYVWLERQEDEKGSRDRRLEVAIEKIQKVRKKKSEEKKDEAKAGRPEVAIDFVNLPERIRRISIPNSTESNLVFSHDGKKLAFIATVDGKRGTYTVEFPDKLSPQSLSTSTVSSPRWLENGSLVGLVSSLPATVSDKGSTTSHRFRARQEYSRSARFAAAFDQCWQTMRNRWYDENLNNRNWDRVRRTYREAAASAPDEGTFSTIVHLMLGELNGSHLGFRASSSGSRSSEGWTDTTAHLGVRYDGEHRGPGLKVRDVLTGGPADRAGIDLRPGDVILRIDGIDVDPDMDLTGVLNGPLDRDIRLRVQRAARNAGNEVDAPNGEDKPEADESEENEDETRNKRTTKPTTTRSPGWKNSSSGRSASRPPAGCCTTRGLSTTAGWSRNSPRDGWGICTSRQ